MVEFNSKLKQEMGNIVSIEYGIATAYGLIMANGDSDVASAIMEAYCDEEDPLLGEINIFRLQKDYPSINVSTSGDSWSGSIKDNVIFYVEDTYRDINPRDSTYDAFYTKELKPDAEAKRELNQFLVRFGIDDKPGICIWASVY